jgi:hypothetical protein
MHGDTLKAWLVLRVSLQSNRATKLEPELRRELEI